MTVEVSTELLARVEDELRSRCNRDTEQHVAKTCRCPSLSQLRLIIATVLEAETAVTVEPEPPETVEKAWSCPHDGRTLEPTASYAVTSRLLCPKCSRTWFDNGLTSIPHDDPRHTRNAIVYRKWNP